VGEPQRADGQRGATVVEFLGVTVLVAVALTVLLQLAMWLWTRNVVVNAVDEGARVAAESGREIGAGADRTRSVLHDGLGGSAARFEVAGMQAGDAVVIRARGVAPSFVPFLPALTVESEGRALDEDAAVP
jgi:hypothetical protein